MIITNNLKYFVYILECADGTFYTGVTNDLEKRLALHNAGKGAKYTMGRGPVVLNYSEEILDRGSALKREVEIKRLTRVQKMRLVDGRI